MKLMFSGCRDREPKRSSILAALFLHKPKIVLIGDANGVDAAVRRICEEEQQDYMVFEADWKKHGKAAGPIRNQEMLKEADKLIAFWDGKSPGTRNAILTAIEMNVRLEVKDLEIE